MPIAVFTASWDLLTWAPLWAALLGDPAARQLSERNLESLTFNGQLLGGLGATDVRYSRGAEAFRRSLVADLRLVQGRYPSGPRLRALIDDLLKTNDEFAEMWNSGAVGEHQSESKVLVHPTVGEIVLECDVLGVAGSASRRAR